MRVRLRDRLARLQDHIDRDRRFLRPVRLDDRAQVGALEVLHHDVRLAEEVTVQLADIDHARDVITLELGRRPRLAHEPLHDLVALQHLGQQHLDRDGLTELDMGGLEHHAHPPLADHPVDTVLAEQHRAGWRKAMSAGTLASGRHHRTSIQPKAAIETSPLSPP